MDEWISKQNTLIKVAQEKQSKTDHHALVEYDPAVTEYPINSYVLFKPPVGRSDKLFPKSARRRVFPRWFLVGETPHISVQLRLAYELRPVHYHYTV